MRTDKTFNELTQKIIEIYESILGKNPEKNNPHANFVMLLLDFLRSSQNISNFQVGNIDPSYVAKFFNLLLDCVGLVAATGGTFETLKLGDKKLIGRKKDIGGIFRGNDETIEEQLCALLFQGWVKLKDDKDFVISKDLKNIIGSKRKACDYLLTQKNKEQREILVECKRIHPSKVIEDKTKTISNLLEKIRNRIEIALKQIKETEESLNRDQVNNGKYERHILMDVSRYGETNYHNFGDHTIVGMTCDDEIKDIADNILKFCNPEIDCLTICWSELYIFENCPRAIVYRTKTIPINTGNPVFTNYGGWTIEFYPSGERTNEYRELRVSSVARTQAWIKASWYSCTNNLLTFGPEEYL